MRKRTYDDWLKTRPPEVRRVASELHFAPFDKVSADLWFLGFNEWEGGGVGLIVSPLDPGTSKKAYAAAYAARQQICPACTMARRWEPCIH